MTTGFSFRSDTRVDNNNNNNNDNDLIVCLLVFMGTSLACRCYQRRQRVVHDKKMDPKWRKRAIMDFYLQRRREDRLSFHELDKFEPATPSAKKLQLQQSDVSSESVFVEKYEDCFPSIKNWSHFEGFHCHELPELYIRVARPFTRASSFESEYSKNLDKMLEGDDRQEDTHSDLSSDDESSGDDSWFSTTTRNLPKRRVSISNTSEKITVPSSLELTFKSPFATPLKNFFRFGKKFDEMRHATKKHTKSTSAQIPKMPSVSSLPRRTKSVPELTKLVDTPSKVTMKRTVEKFASAVSLVNTSRLQKENRLARAQYNARIMPDKLILIRHGQSLGNVDESLYSTTPDNAMPLTDLGWEQARAAGKQLKEKLVHRPSGAEGIHFIISPYARTVETFHGIVSAWCDPSEFNHIEDRELRLQAWYSKLFELGLTWNEDPRIREQDFGNYQEPEKIRQAKRDRHRFGAFYYRFPHGESASDVSNTIWSRVGT